MNNSQTSCNSLISLIEVSENEAENGPRLISLIEVDERGNQIAGKKLTKRTNSIKLKNINRVVRNWKKCLACNENKKLQRPSKYMRLYFCKSKKLYIQKNDRVCKYHAEQKNWDQIQCKKSTNFSDKMVDEMVSFLLNAPMDKYSMNNIDIGLTELQFKKLLSELGFKKNPNKKQNKKIKSVKLYLERLRHGHTYQQMAYRHNITRRTVGAKIKEGRNIILQRFVPRNIGYEIRSRQWLLDHTTELARMLYCKKDSTKCVCILDGTYIYTCSSTNYSHQRYIYSGQKRRHLFKIMKVIATDGTIIDVFGPFPATLNDAGIIKKVFDKTTIGNIFNAGDVILVDRGFRDCKNFIQQKKLVVKMPEFIEKGQNRQLTAKQGNMSRLVTKMRFAIEVANGRMKNKWQIFAKIIPSILKKCLMPDYKIGAALLNRFAKPILCDKNDYLNIGNRMLSLLDSKNYLQPIIDSNIFKRIEKRFLKEIEPNMIKFPRYDQKQLKLFCLGTYAIKQAISYSAQHIKIHGKFKISVLSKLYVLVHFGRLCGNFEEPSLISAEILSRFRSKKSHKVYILYDSNATIPHNIFYYCKCQHGRRTIGCCAHVMCVVWYFGYGKYFPFKNPASYLDDFFDLV